jgi:hypothetical protein
MIEAKLLFRAPTGRILLPQGADDTTWDFRSTEVADGEGAERAALRGSFEATGYRIGHTNGLGCKALVDSDIVAVYLHEAGEEFAPRISARHLAFMWVRPETALSTGKGNPVDIADNEPETTG